ncbi:MAG: OsmC family protein [Bacteroidales bacterium]|jgi:uncharacterized OsmC-like protein
MKTSAKWISDNNYILNNSKHLNLAVSDPVKRKDNYELNCLDLLLMGLAGCITAEFKKQLIMHSISLHGIETDVEIETRQTTHPNFSVHVTCEVKSGARCGLLEECLERAIDSSFIAILFREAGIKIYRELKVTTPAHYSESFTG